MTEQNQDMTPEPKAKMPRWAKFTLIGSLALNLLVLGLIGGAALKFHHGPGWKHGHMRGMGFARHYFRGLPRERRKEIRSIIRKRRAELKPYWMKIREARKVMATAIGQDPFDKEKLQAALTALHKAEFASREASQVIMTDIAQQLTPQERKEFLEHFERRARKFEKRRREKMKDK